MKLFSYLHVRMLNVMWWDHTITGVKLVTSREVGWQSNKELGVSGWVKSKLGGCLEWAFGCSRVGGIVTVGPRRWGEGVVLGINE